MNPFEILRNPQALKEQADKFQQELAEISATGSAGGNGLFPAPGSLGRSDAGPLRRTCRFSGRNGSSCG